MDTKTIIETAEEHLIHTYNRYQIVLDKGDGVHLYDTDGKEYLDFGAGIAVFALGYNNKEYNDALKTQIDKLVHTSNYFYNEPAAKAAKMLTKATGMDRVFFTNSGTEAVEGAIKLAKKYAYLKDGSTDHEIIAMEHSFHGRSMGALAVTGNKHYQEAFGPMIPGIRFAQYNNLESVKELVNEKTQFFINPTGRFVVGGPHGDSGLTGRKIIVDTYGGYARHGGGAFSGKDCTKVDRSAAYAARYVAKNIVAAGLADKCEIQLSYAIGVAHPTSVMVDTFGTGKLSDEKIVEIIRENFDLRPAGIIKMLDLRRPIYRQTAAYGHFGRVDLNLPWEQLDKVDLLKKYL